jgi:hypothetical protein
VSRLQHDCGDVAAGAHLHLDRIERFIRVVGAYEDKIFQARGRKLNADKRRQADRRYQDNFRQTVQGISGVRGVPENSAAIEPEVVRHKAEEVNGAVKGKGRTS